VVLGKVPEQDKEQHKAEVLDKVLDGQLALDKAQERALLQQPAEPAQLQAAVEEQHNTAVQKYYP
jgi:hypothetical protein